MEADDGRPEPELEEELNQDQPEEAAAAAVEEAEEMKEEVAGGKEQEDKNPASNQEEGGGRDGDGGSGSSPPPPNRNIEGGSPGKIFVGGLAKDTTSDTFVKHFEEYGAITDSVIMKDRRTGQPRGFGFITYADPSVVDKVIQDNHVIHGKQVEIKRTIPKGAIPGTKDFKTKKIFVGGIPTTVNEDELEGFFSKFGEVREHQIMRDHSTNRSRGFAFVTFDSEQSVDDLLAQGNRVDFAGAQVEIKKAEPKNFSNPLPAPRKNFGNSRPAFGAGYSDSYSGFGGGGYRAGSYRTAGQYGDRPGAYGGYGGSEFVGGYEGYDGGGLGPYRGEPAMAYSSRFGRGGFGRGYDYGAIGEGYMGYGGAGASGYGSSYDSGPGSGYGGGAGYGGGYGGSGGSLYGNRGGYGGAGAGGRYHPYAR